MNDKDRNVPEDRRDFNKAERDLIRRGKRSEAKVAWHKRTDK